MAAANSFYGGTTRCQCLILPNKLYSRSSSSKLLSSTIVHPQPTKIWSFSVRACGRADNNKLLQFDVRKRPIDAIDFSGRRATIRDVANKDNFKLNQAKKALQDLAADTNDQVWDGCFFHKNLALKPQTLFQKGKVAVLYLIRVSFWMSLALTTVVRLTVILLEAIILGFFGSPVSSSKMDNIQISSKHVCCAQLVDWIFSYVFGDGDPNQGVEEKRWKMIELYIALNGSVVTAEEIAPYLDPETTKPGKLNDESYMLPVLQQFDGQPKVDEEGNILYHFPSVHCTSLPRTSREKEYAGRWVDRDIKVDKFFEEHQWEFSKYDDKELALAADLLHGNLFTAVSSGFVLRVTLGWESYFSQYLFLPLLLPVYAVYAVSFLVISSIRRSLIKKRNTEIVKRNEAREERARALESPDISLMQKLVSARSMAQRASIGNDRIDSGRYTDHPTDKLSRSKYPGGCIGLGF
ncbi:hypothetical protein CASFOL_006990 [Castilleja foliolosa]|uniref:Uncharacterized protein n=1 Tax=Castilleja foliolosa TaxID=1961234 RepID=A0ABD3EA03_9LAMI